MLFIRLEIRSRRVNPARCCGIQSSLLLRFSCVIENDVWDSDVGSELRPQP